MALTEIAFLFVLLVMSTTASVIPTNCQKCADIVFLIDESGSINSTEFQELKYFLDNVIDQFPNLDGPERTQFGAVCFNHNSRLHFDLNEYTTASGYKTTIQDDIVQLGGFTGIGRGLKLVRENSFTVAAGGGRPCAKNNEFIILLTDGKNNRVPPEPKDEADLLKADNKFIIVVAIGNGVDIAALNEIASVSGGTPQVFQTTFSTLGDIIDSLTTEICTTPTTPKPCRRHIVTTTPGGGDGR